MIPDPHLAGIILAGGESRRMGTVKALLDYRGRTFLDTLAETLAAACGRVVVVLGYHGDLIRREARARVEFVVNRSPEQGQLSSLQCGLRAVRSASGAIFTPVDLPAVTPRTVELLAGALRSGAPLAIPRAGGRRGHPAGIAAGLFNEFLALPPEATARDVIAAHESGIRYIDVDDPGILTDVDTPEAYRSLP